jgi:hypothetical protein
MRQIFFLAEIDIFLIVIVLNEWMFLYSPSFLIWSSGNIEKGKCCPLNVRHAVPASMINGIDHPFLRYVFSQLQKVSTRGIDKYCS